MFKIFKRRKDKPALAYGIVQYINKAVEREQRKIAGYLNQKTKGYSKRKWGLCLCGFCLLFGGMAMIILYSSIGSKQSPRKNKFYQQGITIPSSVLQQGRGWDTLKMLEEIYQHRKDSVFERKNIEH